MAIGRFSLVALDCPDPHALAEFYRSVVGGRIRHGSSTGWVQLEIDGSADIAFQRVADHRPPDWPDGSPQQAHIDVDVPDLDEGELQVLAVGARKTDVQPDPDSFRVYLDPAGHPFCLVKASPT